MARANGNGRIELERRDYRRVAITAGLSALGILLAFLALSHGIAVVWGGREVRLKNLEEKVLSTEQLRQLVKSDIDSSIAVAIAPLNSKLDTHLAACDERGERLERMYEQWIQDGYSKARGEPE